MKDGVYRYRREHNELIETGFPPRVKFKVAKKVSDPGKPVVKLSGLNDSCDLCLDYTGNVTPHTNLTCQQYFCKWKLYISPVLYLIGDGPI